jgi:hypothetical protein
LKKKRYSSDLSAEKVGFFYGAGATIEFGIPSMKELTTNFTYKNTGMF